MTVKVKTMISIYRHDLLIKNTNINRIKMQRAVRT